MILEGIVTTLNADGLANISPMGPRVSADMRRFTLRPYTTSTTYKNLRRLGQGVLHVTDDVELFAHATIGKIAPPLLPIDDWPVPRLADTCRWYAFRVTLLQDAAERTTIECEVVTSGETRSFFGFNRAKHAVIEGAILASRAGILPASEIRSEMARLAVMIDKTAGEQERRAWNVLADYLREKLT